MTTYSDACRDPNLFGDWFSADSWATWRVLDKALFGQPLIADELTTFRELTGRDEAPSKPAREAWFIMGRRSGKDIKAASLAVYLATIGADLSRLAPGERGVVQLLAVDRAQAEIALRYVRAFFEKPLLAPMLTRETEAMLELSNGLAIEITTADRRRARGRTVVCAIFGEVAHWWDETTQNPDVEVYRSIRPSMITVPNALLIGMSSPHSKRGLLWDKHKKHFGQPGDVLVVQAPTWVMNPTLARDKGEIADAYADDPSWARAEYGSEFRSDPMELPRETVDAPAVQRVFVADQPTRFAPSAPPAAEPRPRKARKPPKVLTPTPFYIVTNKPRPGDEGSIEESWFVIRAGEVFLCDAAGDVTGEGRKIERNDAGWTAKQMLREKLATRRAGPNHRPLVYPVLKC